MHSNYKKLKALFYEHRDKVKVCLSGHNRYWMRPFESPYLYVSFIDEKKEEYVTLGVF